MKSRNSGKSESEEGQRRLMVLIDADNAQPSVIEGLLAEVAKYGVASVKRIYGDFTSTRLTQWKQVLLKHSINPVQQFTYTSGKNATDSSLIIDAMDLMYTARFDGVCLVSSDSDFTRLAQRMREEGLIVYGFGERKTPDAFVQACDKFIYTEVLRGDVVASPPAAVGASSTPTTSKQTKPSAKESKTTPPAPQAKPIAAVVPSSPPAKPKPLPLPLDLLRRAIEEASDDKGWAHLGAVGSYLTKVRPDFDPRLYGHKKLSDLLKNHPKQFNLEERGAGGSSVMFVRAVG